MEDWWVMQAVGIGEETLDVILTGMRSDVDGVEGEMIGIWSDDTVS